MDGEYSKPEGNIGNKAITTNGGATWRLAVDNQNTSYKSCVQYVSNTGGKRFLQLVKREYRSLITME